MDTMRKIMMLMGGGAAAPTYHTTLPTGLISYWELDESSDGSGEVVRVDTVGAHNAADPDNTPSDTSAFGGNAVAFTRANGNYLAVTDHADLRGGDRDWTIDGWFYYTSASVNMSLVQKGTAYTVGGYEYWLFLTSGTLTFRLSYGSSMVSVAATSQATINKWHYFNFGFDSVNNKVWVALDGNAPVEAEFTSVPITTEGTLKFGTRNDLDANNFLDGRLAHVARWNKVMSASERLARAGAILYPFEIYADSAYITKLLAVSENLVALWPNDDRIGSVIARDAGAGNYYGKAVDVAYGTATGIGDGKKAARFALETNLIDIASCIPAVNKDEYTLMVWWRMEAGGWTDGLEHRIVHLEADVYNKIGHVKTLAEEDEKIDLFRRAQSITQGENPADLNIWGSTTWIQTITTSSVAGDFHKIYVNGSLIKTETGPVTMLSALNTLLCNIGAKSSSTQYFLGDIGPVALWSAPLDASVAEIASLT